MSSHADTIRERAEWWLANEGDTGTVSGRSMQLARDSLALLAELALSRNLYDELFAQTEQLRAENQRLREIAETLGWDGVTWPLDGTPSAAE